MLEYFVLEVTPISAANLPDIHPNTADLFYKKIRQIISFHLALEAK
jgi:transposase